MSVLFVNDPGDLCVRYEFDEGREEPVEVDFVADNGMAVRLCFDPRDGRLRLLTYGDEAA